MEKPYQESTCNPCNVELLKLLQQITKSADEVDFTEGKNCIYKAISNSEVMPQENDYQEESDAQSSSI